MAKQSSPHLIDPEFNRVFERFDANGDGKISPEEFISCLKSSGMDSSVEQDFERRFKHFDRDDDGFISVEELAYYLGSTDNDDDYYNNTPWRLKEAFDMYEDKDKDENNNHTYSILKSLLKKIPLDLDCKGAISTLWKTFIWQLATTIVRKLADKAAARFLPWFPF